MPKKQLVVPADELGTQLAWEQLRSSYWSQMGRDVTEIEGRINRIVRRIQESSMEQG